MNISRYNLMVFIILVLIFMQSCATAATESKPAEFDCKGKSLIGIAMEDVQVPKGVRVIRLWEGKPADRAGVKTGDIIINVGGIDTEEKKTLYDLVQKLPADIPAEFLVLRNDKKIKLTVIPTSACRAFGRE